MISPLFGLATIMAAVSFVPMPLGQMEMEGWATSGRESLTSYILVVHFPQGATPEQAQAFMMAMMASEMKKNKLRFDYENHRLLVQFSCNNTYTRYWLVWFEPDDVPMHP